MLASTWHHRAKLCTAFMNAYTKKLQQELQEITSVLASVYFLQILVHDSGKISKYSLKQATNAIDTFIDMVVMTHDGNNELIEDELRDPEEKDPEEDMEENTNSIENTNRNTTYYADY